MSNLYLPLSTKYNSSNLYLPLSTSYSQVTCTYPQIPSTFEVLGTYPKYKLLYLVKYIQVQGQVQILKTFQHCTRSFFASRVFEVVPKIAFFLEKNRFFIKAAGKLLYIFILILLFRLLDALYAAAFDE